MLVLWMVGCAKGPDKEAKQAQHSMDQAPVQSQSKNCTGTGTDSSGIYSIEAQAGSGKCSDNQESVETLGVAFAIDCEQKDAVFQCKTHDDKISLDGCINANGSFTVSSKTDLNSFEKLIGSSGADSAEKLTIIEANIDKDHGKGTLKYSNVLTKGTQKKGCNMIWNIEVQKI